MELRPDPCCRTCAERLGDEALLAGRLHAVLLEDRADARDRRYLGVDVGDGVRQPLELELAANDSRAVLAQQTFRNRAQLLDLLAHVIRERAELVVRLRDSLRAELPRKP